jgi:hypothetical protein
LTAFPPRLPSEAADALPSITPIDKETSSSPPPTMNMASNGALNGTLPERPRANGTSSSDPDYEPINVIIPIGGIGSRFAKQGYRYPKPLINIVGRPMLLWLIDNLSLKPKDTLWMAVNEDVDDEFRIGQLVSKTFSRIDFRLLRLRHQTKGASETVGTRIGNLGIGRS